MLKLRLWQEPKQLSEKCQMSRNVLVLCVVTALIAGCSTTSQQGSAAKEDLVRATRSIVGTELVGAKGATARDQDKIDDTVSGLCATRVYTKDECQRHQEVAGQGN